MRVFEILEEEHQRICEMLDVLDAVCEALGGKAIDAQDLASIVRFFQRYADACHHAKEENILFPALLDAGMPREGGPVAVMLHEHVQGRALVSAMARAAQARDEADPEAAADFARAGREFSLLLRAHIEKEDEVLFQMGRQFLATADESAMLADYERHEAREVPAAEKSELLSVLASLRSRHT